jgi:hypothetical protein
LPSLVMPCIWLWALMSAGAIAPIVSDVVILNLFSHAFVDVLNMFDYFSPVV